MKTFGIQEYLKVTGFDEFNPKVVLFDMDGVIYDSMPNHATSWHSSMAKVGLDMRPEEAYKYEGMRGVETIKLLARRQWHKELTDAEAQTLYDVKAEEFRKCPEAEKMEGVEDFMKKIKACGMKIVVVTGSGQRSLLGKLEDAFSGLVSSNLIVTSFDVKHGKPSPEPYLCGMEKAEIQPWEGIVIENAPLGVRSAVAAKLFTIAVNTGPLPDKMLKDEGANLIFKDMPTLRDTWNELYKTIINDTSTISQVSIVQDNGNKTS